MSEDDRAPPGLDLHHLQRQTGGDGALADELLVLFEAQCARLMPVIQAGPAAARREAAHAMRGAALAVGAERVAALAAVFDHDGDEHEGGAVHRICADLELALAETALAIDAHRNRAP